MIWPIQTRTERHIPHNTYIHKHRQTVHRSDSVTVERLECVVVPKTTPQPVNRFVHGKLERVMNIITQISRCYHDAADTVNTQPQRFNNMHHVCAVLPCVMQQL